MSTQCRRVLCRSVLVGKASFSLSFGGVTITLALSLPSLTIPELLLILEIIRHLKFHVVVAGLFPESSSPATKATKGCTERRKLVVDGQLFASSPTCRRRFTGVRLVRHRVYSGRSLPALAGATPTNIQPLVLTMISELGGLLQNVLAPVYVFSVIISTMGTL